MCGNDVGFRRVWLLRRLAVGSVAENSEVMGAGPKEWNTFRDILRKVIQGLRKRILSSVSGRSSRDSFDGWMGHGN
jgi:hypothetical protein